MLDCAAPCTFPFAAHALAGTGAGLESAQMCALPVWYTPTRAAIQQERRISWLWPDPLKYSILRALQVFLLVAETLHLQRDGLQSDHICLAGLLDRLGLLSEQRNRLVLPAILIQCVLTLVCRLANRGKRQRHDGSKHHTQS